MYICELNIYIYIYIYIFEECAYVYSNTYPIDIYIDTHISIIYLAIDYSLSFTRVISLLYRYT